MKQVDAPGANVLMTVRTNDMQTVIATAWLRWSLAEWDRIADPYRRLTEPPRMGVRREECMAGGRIRTEFMVVGEFDDQV